MPRATPLSAEQRRAAIVAATEPLLVRHGRSVSTREIAAAAGVAEGTIFRVFPNKDALVDAVVEDAFDATALCAELAQVDLTLDLETRLVAAAELLHTRLTRAMALFHTLVARPAHPRAFAAMRARRERERELIHTAVAAVLAPDAERLTLPPGDAATLLSAMLMSAAHPMLPGQPAPEPRQIVAVLVHGILASGRDAC